MEERLVHHWVDHTAEIGGSSQIDLRQGTSIFTGTIQPCCPLYQLLLVEMRRALDAQATTDKQQSFTFACETTRQGEKDPIGSIPRLAREEGRSETQ